MAKSPLVTVVIPMYNVERYVRATLESLKNQTFSDFEVIIVNDGSTDLSREIAVRTLETSRIKWSIVDQPNQGVSVARNVGVAAARGRYIKFLDADDMLFPRALETLAAPASDGGYQVVIGKYILRTLRNKKIFTMDTLGKLQPGPQNNRDLILRSLNFRPFIHLGCTLIENRVILENHLRFTNGIRISEDVEFISKALYLANGVYVVGDFVYDWIRRPHSATKTKSATMFHHVAVLRRLAKFFEEYGDTELSQKVRAEVLPLAFVQVLGILAYNRMDYETWRTLLRNPVVQAQLANFRYTLIREGRNFERLARVVRRTLRISPGLIYLLLRAVRRYHEFFER